jgi:hypothetical protein
MGIIHDDTSIQEGLCCNIPSLFNIDYQKVAAIAKAISEFEETGIYTLTPQCIQ